MDDWSIRLRRAVAQQLASLGAAGVQQLSNPAHAPAPSAAPPMVSAEPTGDGHEHNGQPSSGGADAECANTNNNTVNAATIGDVTSPTASASAAPVHLRLAELEREVATCEKCPALAASRTQTVFGTGASTAELCFFGEAPGADEDRRGEPFVGAAGQLLTDIIQKGMKLRREDVYILNVLKCRPPGNRNPEEGEIANCQPYYQRQLEIIQPKFICCLGGYAARTLLDTDLSVGRLRGSMHDYQGQAFRAKVLVTYHPAYLLRREEEKSKTWADVKLLMREMGL